jgi:hypothetical protein
MRNAAERSFWTLADHPPDLGVRFFMKASRVGSNELRDWGRPAENAALVRV